MVLHPTDVVPAALAIEIVGAISLARGTLATDHDLARTGTGNDAALSVGWRIADDTRTRIGLACLAIGFIFQFAEYGLQTAAGDTDPPSWWSYLLALAVTAASPRIISRLQRTLTGRRLTSVLGARAGSSSSHASWSALILDGAGFSPAPGESDVDFVERITGIRMPATAGPGRADDEAANAGGEP